VLSLDEINKNPFFILGNPRSGTSLLRLMLNSHPQICVPPECGFIEWWYEKYCGWNKNKSRDENAVDEYVRDILSSKKMETWQIEENKLSENILFHLPENYAQLCLMVCLTFAQKKNKAKLKRWGDKNNYYIQRMHKLLTIFPSAQFILIIRDGRDVACSYKSMQKLESASVYKPKLPHKIDDIANEWLANNQRVLNFFDTLPEDQKCILKYENLVTNTENELEKICKFTGLDFSGDMLNYFLHNKENQDEPAALMDWKKKTMEKPDPSNYGKYKKELMPEEVNIFNSISGEMLKQFNYEV